MAIEHWLRSNRRPYYIAITIVAVIFALSLVICLVPQFGWPGKVIGGALLALSVITFWGMWILVNQSRLACDGENLLVGLEWMGYTLVPLEIVECFFIGQGASMMRDEAGMATESVTVVVRLADAAKDWHQKEVNSKLGQWCDGYIVVRGTWSEPLDREKLEEMNRQLLAAKKKQKQPSA